MKVPGWMERLLVFPLFTAVQWEIVCGTKSVRAICDRTSNPKTMKQAIMVGPSRSKCALQTVDCGATSAIEIQHPQKTRV